jgi:hypothetical protein
MIGKTIPTPMASIIKVVKMKRKGPVSFILLTDILVLLHKRRFAAIGLTLKKQKIKNLAGVTCPINTSTFRNFETISSGFGRLFVILDPLFLKYNSGPIQMRRLSWL